jgi:hypothetical protein
MIEHLVGMQAQNPNDPYFGLWARMHDFGAEDLSALIGGGRAVRGQLMRGTLHLVTAADHRRLRPLFDALCSRILGSTQFGKDTKSIDRDRLLASSRSLLARQPMSRADLGTALAEEFPGVPPGSLAQTATYLLPVIQAPPRGQWGQAGSPRWTVADHDDPDDDELNRRKDDLFLRYLRSFGPASLADVRAWSGLTGLGAVTERLRPRLRYFTDEKGTTLLDVEDGVIVDPECPAPPRLLPEYDNVLLGHADRSRFFHDMGPFPPGWVGNVLIDGFYAGHWRLDPRSRDVEVTVQRPVGVEERTELAVETERLLARVGSPGKRGSPILKGW